MTRWVRAITLSIGSVLSVSGCALMEFASRTVVWGVTVPADVVSRAPVAQLAMGGEGGSMPIHGNWCGPGHPKLGENPPPEDATDAACMRHDFCYDQKGYFDCSCDQQLIQDILIVRDYESLEPMTVEWRIVNYFAASSCRGGCKVVKTGSIEQKVCGADHPRVEAGPDPVRVRVRTNWIAGGSIALARGRDLDVFGRRISWGGDPCTVLLYCCLWTIVEVQASYNLGDENAVIGLVERAKGYALGECGHLGNTSIGVRVYRAPFDPSRLEEWVVQARFSGISGNSRLSELRVRSR